MESGAISWTRRSAAGVINWGWRERVALLIRTEIKKDGGSHEIAITRIRSKCQGREGERDAEEGVTFECLHLNTFSVSIPNQGSHARPLLGAAEEPFHSPLSPILACSLLVATSKCHPWKSDLKGPRRSLFSACMAHHMRRAPQQRKRATCRVTTLTSASLHRPSACDSLFSPGSPFNEFHKSNCPSSKWMTVFFFLLLRGDEVAHNSSYQKMYSKLIRQFYLLLFFCLQLHEK